jgi:hypothetical protein
VESRSPRLPGASLLPSCKRGREAGESILLLWAKKLTYAGGSIWPGWWSLIMGSQVPCSTRPLYLCEERKRYKPSPLLFDFNQNRGRWKARLLSTNLKNHDGPGVSSSSDTWQGHLRRTSPKKLHGILTSPVSSRRPRPRSIIAFQLFDFQNI